MLHIREAIVVEGRYDKHTLSQVVDALIVETSGFGIFKDGNSWPSCGSWQRSGGSSS